MIEDKFNHSLIFFFGISRKRLRKNCEEKLSVQPFYILALTLSLSLFFSVTLTLQHKTRESELREREEIFQGWGSIWIFSVLLSLRALALFMLSHGKLKIRQVGSFFSHSLSLLLFHFYSFAAFTLVAYAKDLLFSLTLACFTTSWLPFFPFRLFLRESSFIFGTFTKITQFSLCVSLWFDLRHAVFLSRSYSRFSSL